MNSFDCDESTESKIYIYFKALTNVKVVAMMMVYESGKICYNKKKSSCFLPLYTLIRV